MTNREFVKSIMELYPGTFRDDVQKMVQIVFNGMRSALAKGESLNIPGLGTFSPEFVDQHGRTWENPATGEITELEDKFRLRFKASRQFEKTLTERMLEIELRGGTNV